jgi:crotonobetaine/carnitine-CoA ligase
VDRKKDAIRRRGENISSFEIEKIINGHAKVKECVAIAVPSELGEDEVKICVLLKEDEKLQPEEPIQFCEGKIPYFAIPRYVEFLESLPKTPTEKILKKEFRVLGITGNKCDRDKSGYKLKK